MQHLLAGRGRRARRPPRARPATPGRPTGSAKRDAVELDRHRAGGQRRAASAGSAISGSMSSTSNTRSKLTSAVTTSRRARGQRGQRARRAGLSSSAIVTTVPGVELALQGEVAAEAVDQRLGEPRHERQRRRRTTPCAIAERTPMSRTRAARRAELVGLLGRAARTASPAWRRAPRSARSSARSSPRCASAASRSSWPTRRPTRRAGITNTGSSTSASSGDLPRQLEHHGQREHERDDVGDDARTGPT